MNKTHLFALLLAFAALILQGCASVGNKMDMAQAQQIQKGVTTRADLERMFGKPNTVSLMPDGKSMAMWFYSSASSSARNFIPVVGLVSSKIDTQTQTLHVIFDAQGKVENYTSNDTNSEMKMGLIK